MNSPILQAATKFLVSLILMFSIYILFRGHHESGGGFIGALIASAAFALYIFAFGADMVKQSLPCDVRNLCFLGISLSLCSGLFSLLFGKPFLTGIWMESYVNKTSDWPISNVLFFDLGVYLTVLGAVLTLLLCLEEEV